MKRNSIRKAFAAICSGILLAIPAAGSLTASAATVEDVIAAAYAVGIPEQYIQEGIYMYGGGNFSSEQCDAAVAQIYSYQGRVDDLLYEYFGVEKPAATTTPAQTQPSQGGTAAPNTPSTPEQDTPSSNAPAGNASGQDTPAQTPDIELPVNDTGKTFAEMTLDEKIAYVNQIPAEDRAAFLTNLTTEERNSFIKQLSMDDKAEVMNAFLSVGNTIGLNFTVDEMTNESIVISARDQDGKLVDVSSMGITIENTGKSYTEPITIAALLAAGGISGISALLFFTGKKRHCEEDA